MGDVLDEPIEAFSLRPFEFKMCSGVIHHSREGERRMAEARCAFQDHIEDRIVIIARCADDFQDFARGGFPLQPPPHLAKLADVLDGDHRLCGECFKQGGLVVGEGLHLVAVQRHTADRDAVLDEGHAEEGQNALRVDLFHRPGFAGEVARVLGEIADLGGAGLANGLRHRGRLGKVELGADREDALVRPPDAGDRGMGARLVDQV